MSKLIFCATAIIGIAAQIMASDEIIATSEYNPATYRSPYLDMIPGSSGGTFHKVIEKANPNERSAHSGAGQTSYVRNTETKFFSAGIDGPSRTDVNTKIKITPGERKETKITKSYPGVEVTYESSVPIGVAKASSATIMSPEIFAFTVAFLASFNVAM